VGNFNVPLSPDKISNYETSELKDTKHQMELTDSYRMLHQAAA
jgi:hypothetical protein